MDPSYAAAEAGARGMKGQFEDGEVMLHGEARQLELDRPDGPAPMRCTGRTPRPRYGAAWRCSERPRSRSRPALRRGSSPSIILTADLRRATPDDARLHPEQRTAIASTRSFKRNATKAGYRYLHPMRRLSPQFPCDGAQGGLVARGEHFISMLGDVPDSRTLCGRAETSSSLQDRYVSLAEKQRALRARTMRAALCLPAALLVTTRVCAQTTDEVSEPSAPSFEVPVTQPEATLDSTATPEQQLSPRQQPMPVPQSAGKQEPVAEPQAQHPRPAAQYHSEPESESRADIHVHDGLYLRLGVGLGYAHSSVTNVSEKAANISGFAVPVELAIGGTPAPGVAIGIGSYGASIPSPALVVNGNHRDSENSQVFSSIGPFVDRYFSPDGGFHAQAGFAFAVTLLTHEFDGIRIHRMATGWAAMFGMGWETWAGEQWSVGVLARVHYASLHADEMTAEAGGYEETLEVDDTFKIVLPALLFTATLH